MLSTNEPLPCDPHTLTCALLNALPTPAAVLGCDGVIQVVNESWAAADHGAAASQAKVGSNYLSIYIEAGSNGAAIVEGISSVLAGRRLEFTHAEPRNIEEGRSRVCICVRPIDQPGTPRQALVSHTKMPNDQFMGYLSEEFSHELRSPLTPVLASVGDLLRNCPQIMGSDVCESLEMIRRNTELEAKLVDDMLTLTRLQVGSVKLHQKSVDVHELIRRVINAFRPELDKNQIELSASLSAEESIAWADPSRLHEVLVNLFSNAIKFTPTGGRVAVGTVQVGSRFQIEISDSGIGIEPKALASLFNPFEHDARIAARSSGGPGLGLSIAKQLIDLHGGSLTARSEGADHGATFTVDLLAGPSPAATAVATLATMRAAVPNAPAPPGAAPTGAAQTEKLRVLLIDDHKDTVITLAKLMRHIGYAVDTATCVAEAIDKLQTDDQYDLLLSDIGLPDGTGLEVVREFRRRNELKRAVALSGFGQPEDIRRSLEAGFNEHLVKPISAEQLDEVLRIAC